jgi:hypothetical protein
MSDNTDTNNHNTKSLVTVENGGVFEMRGVAKVQGNVIQPDQSNVVMGDPIYGGGVLVERGGKFNMYDTSSVYGNRISHPVAAWTSGYKTTHTREQNTKTKAMANPNLPTQTTCADLYGGGVAVFGEFYMTGDASVKDNSIRGEFNTYGGGVYVAEITLSAPDSDGVYRLTGGSFYMTKRATITGNSITTREYTVTNPGWSPRSAAKYKSPAKWERIWIWNMMVGTPTHPLYCGGGGVTTAGAFQMDGGTISSNTLNWGSSGQNNSVYLFNVAPSQGTQLMLYGRGEATNGPYSNIITNGKNYTDDTISK